MSHLVICPAKLETKYRKHILSFQEHLAFESIAEVDGMMKGRFPNNVVHS